VNESVLLSGNLNGQQQYNFQQDGVKRSVLNRILNERTQKRMSVLLSGNINGQQQYNFQQAGVKRSVLYRILNERNRKRMSVLPGA
jgi:DNA-binding TFAR19-related protein (PDSD5 family)